MVTMKKIAELCGVSRGTVDRALNGRGRVNAETAAMIKKMAEQLGYEPNPAGKALAARKGLDLEEPGFSDYQKFREEQLDLLADTIRKSLDMKLVYECLGMETI